MKIGTLTIGQSPRVDVIPELKESIGFEVEIEERGVLDDLSYREIQNLHPEPDDYILVSRMKDGKEVKIAERHIIGRMKSCISDLEKANVDFIILLCTGEFSEEISSRKLILKPSRLMKNMVKGILQRGTIAAIAPCIDQLQLMKKKWSNIYPDLQVIVEAVSPYTGMSEEIERVAERIADTKTDLVILDCLGFDKRMKMIFRKITKKPVLLPRTLLGRIAGELIERSF